MKTIIPLLVLIGAVSTGCDEGLSNDAESASTSDSSETDDHEHGDDDHEHGSDEHSEHHHDDDTAQHDGGDHEHKEEGSDGHDHAHGDGGSASLCERLAAVCHTANTAAKFQVALYKECHEIGHDGDADVCVEAEERCLAACVARVVDAGLDPDAAHQ